VKDSTFFNLNAFTNVTALALTGQTALTEELSTGGVLDAIYVPTFVNKGIVLNVEDFGGRVEISGSTFEKNFHYIPSIVYKGDSKAALSIDMFKDQFTTKELQL